MRMTRCAPAAYLAFVVMAAHAWADSACNHPNNDFDGLYCLNKVYGQADKDLNSAYGKLRGRLDSAGQSALKTGQLTWLKIRNDQCSRREGNDFFVNLACATQTTIERTQFLQDRYRECISSGCLNSKL